MSESGRDLLVRGIAAAKANEADEARFFLEWVLRVYSSPEQQIEAWYWLSEISQQPDEKRQYLMEILSRQPTHHQARRSLALLDGRLDPQEIVDPDRLPPAKMDEQASIGAQRFVCPNCGGRLTYDPSGKALICEYCQQREASSNIGQEFAPTSPEKDFTLTLATAKGHTYPVAMRSFTCQACGGVFLLPPEILSTTCPNCGSVYVIEQAELRQLIPPDGIILFQVKQADAEEYLKAWYNTHKITSKGQITTLRGLYLPVWSFTISGLLPWRCTVYEEGNRITHSGEEFASYRNVLVPASLSFAEKFTRQLETFDLDQITSYKAAYLADWLAEMYQVSLSDASLVARWLVLDSVHALLISKVPQGSKDLHLDSQNLLVEFFRLLLLPFWIGRYQHQDKPYRVFINGQTGKVWGEKPSTGVRHWLDSLLSGRNP